MSTPSIQHAGSSVPTATKRLLHELRAQTESGPHPFIPWVGPVSDAQILQWEAIMKGVPGSAYEGTRRTGEICLDLLKTSWTPAYTMVSTLEAVHQLLAYPEVDSPLNVEVAALLRNGDGVGAESLVRWCCREWRWTEGRR
ncbi:hypothetical protein MMC07_009306 [Pseudocyphellaria aurata]|nr:hypothetical protein [Pseudocyphellaria aurata]